MGQLAQYDGKTTIPLAIPPGNLSIQDPFLYKGKIYLSYMPPPSVEALLNKTYGRSFGWLDAAGKTGK
jgi:hypothetical protein